MKSITDKKKNVQTWDLSTLLNYAKLFGMSEVRLSDDYTMRESKMIIEKRMLEEINMTMQTLYEKWVIFRRVGEYQL